MAAINFPPRTQGVPDLTLVTLGDLSTEYYWTGEQWLSVGLGGGGGASVTIQSTPPSSPSAGDLWFDNDSGILSMYYNDGNSSQWVDVGGGDSGTGAGSVNGIVKSDGAGNFSAAVVGTDYLTSATLGSSPAAAKAWVLYDSTNATPSITKQYNVSSVTKTQTGVCRIQMSTPLDDADYIIVSTGSISNATNNLSPIFAKPLDSTTTHRRTATQFHIETTNYDGTVRDGPLISAIVYNESL